METMTRKAPPPGLSEIVRSHREAHGLSMQQLSQRSGVSYTMIWMIEHGERSLGARSIAKLAPHLGETFVSEVLRIMAEREG